MIKGGPQVSTYESVLAARGAANLFRFNLRHWHKSERRSVEALEAEGYQDLRAVTRELLRAQALGARSP